MIQLDVLDYSERFRIRNAAVKARKLYPGPVGRLIERELTAWVDFGYRTEYGALVHQLVEQLLSTPLPAQEENS